MNVKIIILIWGMEIVTYIPRAIPAVLIDKLNFSQKVKKFLSLIPYTAMAALIVPGVFKVDAILPEIGIIGGLAAGILAWRKVPVMVCVLVAIAVDVLLYLTV